jgi:quercetin dioxygenase-like cupin family protein
MTNPELEELAALDAVGALDETQRAAFVERLASATELERVAVSAIYEAATFLAAAVTPVQPPPKLKEQLLARLRGPADIFSVRAGERQWAPTSLAGVDIQRLHVDTSRNAAILLVRLAPGAVYPPHHHSGPEECYVLSGDVSMDGERLTAGDFHHASGSTDHGTLTSEAGAELLLFVPASDCLPTGG